MGKFYKTFFRKKILEQKIELNNYDNRMILKNVKMDEYFIFNRKIHDDKVIGYYTDGIVTCSGLTISINEDEIILFTHINEESEITKIVKEKFIPKILYFYCIYKWNRSISN